MKKLVFVPKTLFFWCLGPRYSHSFFPSREIGLLSVSSSLPPHRKSSWSRLSDSVGDFQRMRALGKGRMTSQQCGIIISKVRGSKEPGVRCHCKNRVKGSVVVVTGANGGIGYSAAQDLARKGARVYLGCRRHQEGEATAQKLRTTTGNTSVFYLHLDLTDFSSIRLFVSALTKREGRVDAVVNNAAVFHHPPGLTVDNLEVTYHTNFLGVYLLTTQLLSLIQRSPAPRIIFISSEAHKLVSVADLLAFNPREVRALDTFTDHVRNYGISKLALHLFAQHLTETTKGVEVVLADPGNVWTGIYRYSWRTWTEVLTRFRCYALMKGTLEGAQSTIHALNTPSHVHGKYINSFLVAEESSYDGDLVQEFIAATSLMSGLDTHEHHNM